MGNLSNIEVLQLLSMYEVSIDTQFQNWITLTFAAVGASYLARRKLSKSFAHFMTSIYLLATTSIILRWLFEVYRISILIEQYEVVTETFPPWSAILGITTFSMLAIGTMGCVFCIYHFRRMSAGAENEL